MIKNLMDKIAKKLANWIIGNASQGYRVIILDTADKLDILNSIKHQAKELTHKTVISMLTNESDDSLTDIKIDDSFFSSYSFHKNIKTPLVKIIDSAAEDLIRETRGSLRDDINNIIYDDKYIKTLIKKINEYQIVMNHDFKTDK